MTQDHSSLVRDPEIDLRQGEAGAQVAAVSGAWDLRALETRARTLRLRFVATTAFVFVAFVLRATFSTMYAVAFQLRDTNTESCRDICGECRNVYALISNWMTYTPEFQTLIVLISSPVALLVALWSMTPNHLLQPMKSSKRVIAFTTPLTPLKKEEEPPMA